MIVTHLINVSTLIRIRNIEFEIDLIFEFTTYALPLEARVDMTLYMSKLRFNEAFKRL